MRTRDEINPSFWSARDRMFHGPGVIYYAILDTGGCRWARETGGCSMCGYIADTCGREVEVEELKAQVDEMLAILPASKGPFGLKIFTSGSFFDTREVRGEARDYLIQELRGVSGLSELTVESRPEFIESSLVSGLVSGLPDLEIEVAMGLESSSDWVRKNCIGKGFTFERFRKKSIVVRNSGARVKTYLLVKPPFLSEFDAAYDTVKSVEESAEYSDSISINACNVQKGTLVESLYKRGNYRPPWIWTVLRILRSARDALDPSKNLICDTVAFGTRRGPHNCRKCSSKGKQMVRDFSLSQDPSQLKALECDCRGRWTKSFYYHY